LLAEAKNNVASSSAVAVADIKPDVPVVDLAAGKSDAPPASVDSSSCITGSSCVSSTSNGLITTLVNAVPAPVCAAALVTSPSMAAEEVMTSPAMGGEELVVAAGEGQIYYMLVDENSQLENQTILIGKRSVMSSSLPNG